jgi:glycine cleavage system H lipoate-binding protein
MNKNYKCVYDVEGIYTDKVIDSNTLIDDYLEVCNEVEDADLIGWITRLKETDRQEEAIEFICGVWDLRLEELTDETKE